MTATQGAHPLTPDGTQVGQIGLTSGGDPHPDADSRNHSPTYARSPSEPGSLEALP